MKFFFTCALLFFATTVSAAELSDPDNSFLLLDIDAPEMGETYYGALQNFPHTYQFVVTEPIDFSAAVAGAKKGERLDVLTLILVKQERRGVSEVVRAKAKDTTWENQYSGALGTTLRTGSSFETQLEEGVYVLEVSTPENLSQYQLKLNGGASVSLGEVFMARSVFGLPVLGAITSYFIYVPVLFMVLLWWYIRRKKHA